MNRSIDSIVWPARASDAVRLIRLYMLLTIERLGISFEPWSPDPIVVIKELLADNSLDDERKAALSVWWNRVDKYGIQNFESRDALMARLAVCVLAPDEKQTYDFGEQLSWFVEVLGFLSVDVDEAIELMGQHFDFVPA